MKTTGLLLLLLVLPVLSSVAQDDASIPAEGVSWHPFQEAVDLARTHGKKVLIDVYAPWCPWCRRLQREVYTDPAVQAYLAEHFVATRLDGDDEEKTFSFQEHRLTASELAMGLGAQGFPTTVFLESDGQYITRLPGFVDAGEFLTILRFVGTSAYEQESYEEFVKRDS